MKTIKHERNPGGSQGKPSPVADPAGMDGKAAYTMITLNRLRNIFGSYKEEI